MKNIICKTLLFGYLVVYFPSFASAKIDNNFLVVCDSSGKIITLDPHKQFAEKNITVCQQIFEGLLRFTPDGKIEPALAVSWERIDDFRVRFYLRKGVKFHNGEPFNAESVRFSIERYLDPKTNFPGIGFIDSIVRAEIVDGYTIDVVTKYPDGLLLNRMATFVFIVPSEYIRQKGDKYFAEHPIGTGPFRFAKWIKNEKIVLPANENYWRKGYPKLKGLTFVFLPPEQRLKPLLKADIHLVTAFPDTQAHLAIKNNKTDLIKKLSLRGLRIYLNPHSQFFKDLKVRKALNYAINKRDLIRYDLMGNGRILSTLSIPGREGYNPVIKPYEYNITKAKKLLNEAGCPQKFTLKTIVKEGSERSAKVFAFQLAKLGIKLDTKIATSTEILPAVESRKYDMFLVDSPNPMCHNYFPQFILFFSKSPYSMWNDPVFDKMLLDMVSTIDDNLRDKKGQEIDKYIYDNALSIFTYQRMSVVAVNKNVQFEPYISTMPHFFNAYFKTKE